MLNFDWMYFRPIGLKSTKYVETYDTTNLYIPPRGVGGVLKKWGFKRKKCGFKDFSVFFNEKCKFYRFKRFVQ